MAFKEFLWEVPATRLQGFDAGEVVLDDVPAAYDLQPGDELEYTAGSRIFGTAKVVSVDPEPVEVSDWYARIGEGEDPPTVQGRRCGFRRLN